MSKRPPEPLATAEILARARMTGAEFAADQLRLQTAADLLSAEVRSRAPERASNAPPKVTRGESIEARLVLDDGKVLEIPARRGWGGDCAFVDWLNFTVKETTFEWGTGVVTDDQLIIEASQQLCGIFGFGIVSQREKGANFYKRSYVLGDSYGMVCHGGQRHTVLVSISGEGLAAAKTGWELRLHDWLNEADSPRITRVDLTHDVFLGDTYSVDTALSDYEAGNYTCGGRAPDCEQRGNWISPNGKGRTFYVGHRTNGKFARIYEKGKQLGSSDSPWVRCEVEFKSVDREIPFDVLLKAGEYLASAYPAFAWITASSSRIATSKKSAELSYNRMVDWCKLQCGSALWTIAQIEGSLEAAFSLVSRPNEVPRRLQIPAFDSVTDFLHNRVLEVLPVEATIDRAFSTI